jgi:mannose-1-phosphate guanylyltransferase
MKALLLAAGLGTRLRPLTDQVPKCMVEIEGRPLLDHWRELLLEQGPIESITVNTHYLPETVKAWARGSRQSDRILLSHEETLLGTAGTVARYLSSQSGSDLLVAHADNLTLFDVDAFLSHHANRPAGCLATMMTFDTDSPTTCGIVELDHRGVVQRFHEKVSNPPGHRANAAVYIFSAEALDSWSGWLKASGPFQTVPDISLHIVPHLLRRLYTFHNAVYHRDIGNMPSLAAARAEYPAALRRFHSPIEQGTCA